MLSGSTNTLGTEGGKGWNPEGWSKFQTSLEGMYDDLLMPGASASSIERSKSFRYLMSGQDLYRLSRPLTMLKMASSAHLSRIYLNDPSNMEKAYLMSKGKTSMQHFNENPYMSSSRRDNTYAGIGDSRQQAIGRKILTGKKTVMDQLGGLPGLADSVAMKNIWTAVALDNLPAGMPKTAKSIESMDRAFFETVKQKANMAVMQSQPTYEAINRSHLMNHGNIAMKIITRYGTQTSKMMNILAKAHLGMVANDNPQSRQQYERALTSVLGVNVLMMAGIYTGGQMLKDALKPLDKDDEDDAAMMQAWEKEKKNRAGQFAWAAIANAVNIVEGGDELLRLLGGLYGSVNSDKRYLRDRALQGQLGAGELKALLDIVEGVATLGAKKKKIRDAKTKGARRSAQISYANTTKKTTKAALNFAGVSLHLPLGFLDNTVQPSERVRKKALNSTGG